MPIKGLIKDFQDMKGGLGSISRRNFDMKALHFQRVRSHSAVFDDRVYKQDTVQTQQQSCWADMPPELLRDIIQRVEESESTWPSRKDVVACASVCRMWRMVTKNLVATPEQSGKLTFPISVKQPGPRESTMQCFIKRDRISSTYYLYLCLTPTLVESGKFLLAARKFRRATSSDYIISLDADDMSRGGETYVGKLRSNFLGTKFTIYESQPSHCGAVASINRSGTRGPRRMQCTLYSIPVSAVEEGGSAPTPTDFSTSVGHLFSPISFLRFRPTMSDVGCTDLPEPTILREASGNDAPLMLKNKSPRWHEHLECWCLNFKGRVTVASVKNFQLVAAVEQTDLQGSQAAEHENVLLQFGKVGKDTFTMDYRYPLSPFQAFAICLSSFDTKLACE